MILDLRFPKLFPSFKFKNLVKLENKPVTYLNIGTSNQTNIGLDRQNFKFDLNYDWFDKKEQKKQP